MKVEIYANSGQQWDDYVLGHPQANIYHLYAWGIFFKDFYGLKPLNLVVYDDNQKILGLVPLILMKNYAMQNIMVSLPYFCIGGIIADNQETEHVILKKIRELTISHKCKFTLLRSEHISDTVEFDHVEKNKSTFILKLDQDHEKVFNGLQKQIRRRIRKGYQSGCEIDISKKYIDDFYDIYRINMRLLGSPAHKKSFYAEVVNRFPENYTVLVVLYNNKVIGAQLLSYFKKTVYLPLASSLKEFNSYSPNHLLYWESIKYGCENGYELCDFGRSSVESGPYIFKKQWNALEMPLNYGYIYSHPPKEKCSDHSNKKLHLISNIWQRTPLAVTNFLGPKLSKWLP